MPPAPRAGAVADRPLLHQDDRAGVAVGQVERGAQSDHAAADHRDPHGPAVSGDGGEGSRLAGSLPCGRAAGTLAGLMDQALIDSLRDSETASSATRSRRSAAPEPHTYAMDGRIRCMTPDLPPLVGEAITIKIDTCTRKAGRRTMPTSR